MAALTFQDIINEALGILGVYTGDPLAASESQSAFFTLQAIIDGYGAEALIIQENEVSRFVTTAGKSQYTLGVDAGNDWVVSTLPPSFSEVTMSTGALEIPLEILTPAKWAMLALKSLQSSILSGMWPNFGPTVHTLSFYPVPGAIIPINLYTPEILSAPTATGNTFTAAPGYQELYTFELAIKASSKFGAQIPAWVPPAWADAKAKIKGANFNPLDVYCDAALVSLNSKNRTLGRGSIAFYTGE